MFRSLCLLVPILLSDPTLPACLPIHALGLTTVSSTKNSLLSLPHTIQDTEDPHDSKLDRFSALVPDTSRAISSLITRTATVCRAACCRTVISRTATACHTAIACTAAACRDPRRFCRRRAPRPESRSVGGPPSSSILDQDPAKAGSTSGGQICSDADLAARGRALKLGLGELSKNRSRPGPSDQLPPISEGSAAPGSGKRAAATSSTTSSNSPNDDKRHALLEWTSTRSSTSSSGRPSAPSAPGPSADIEAQNNELIDAMHEKVGMLRNFAMDIGREIKVSNAIVEGMGGGMDKGRETLDKMKRKVGGWMGM